MRKIISLMLMMTLCLPALTSCTASADQRTGEAEGYGGFRGCRRCGPAVLRQYGLIGGCYNV